MIPVWLWFIQANSQQGRADCSSFRHWSRTLQPLTITFSIPTNSFSHSSENRLFLFYLGTFCPAGRSSLVKSDRQMMPWRLWSNLSKRSQSYRLLQAVLSLSHSLMAEMVMPSACEANALQMRAGCHPLALCSLILAFSMVFSASTTSEKKLSR